MVIRESCMTKDEVDNLKNTYSSDEKEQDLDLILQFTEL